MTAREKKIRKEDESAASAYLKKASDNYEQMLVAYHASNWNAACCVPLDLIVMCWLCEQNVSICCLPAHRST